VKPEEINVAIAKACGWTDIRIIGNRWFGVPPNVVNDSGDGYRLIPDYAGDLNKMHEVEKTLIGIGWQYADYAQKLKEMTGGWSFNATALQRAEAFLRTIGK